MKIRAVKSISGIIDSINDRDDVSKVLSATGWTQHQQVSMQGRRKRKPSAKILEAMTDEECLREKKRK